MSELLMHPMGGGTGSDDLTATAANVLSGKTAVTSDSDDEAITGTMANNGAMDVTLTPAGNGTTSKEVAEGYYSGGTITADGAAAYSAGHSQGVTDADNRVNTSSASYNSGYANGKAGARLVLISQTNFANYETKTISIASGILIWQGDVKKYDCFMKNLSAVTHLIDAYAIDQGNNGNPISLQSATDATVTFNGRYGTLSAYQIQ